MKSDLARQREEETRARAHPVPVEVCMTFLKQLCKKTDYTILSAYPTINRIRCSVWKENLGFGFETAEFNLVPYPVQYQHVSYGLHAPLSLEREGRIYDIRLGAGSSSIPLGQGFFGRGEFWELEWSNTGDKDFYLAIIPCEERCDVPVSFIDSEPFKDADWVRPLGYVTIRVNDYGLAFYDCSIEKRTYLFLSCSAPIARDTFEKLVYSVLFSFALVSGHLQRGELYLLRSANAAFTQLNGFLVKKIESSLSGMRAISPKEHCDFSSLTKRENMPAEVFSTLVSQAFNNPELLRTIRIITESFEHPIQLQAATYTVALESIKNIIIEKNEAKVQPIGDKKKAAEVIAALKAVVENFNTEIFNNKASLIKRLENINYLGNTESFFKIFELLEIELNEDDKRCIGMRNEFLHGRMPFDNEPGLANDYEIHHVVYKLHLLISACILKSAGFSGYLRNNVKFADILKFNKGIEEDLFRKI